MVNEKALEETMKIVKPICDKFGIDINLIEKITRESIKKDEKK